MVVATSVNWWYIFGIPLVGVPPTSGSHRWYTEYTAGGAAVCLAVFLTSVLNALIIISV